MKKIFFLLIVLGSISFSAKSQVRIGIMTGFGSAVDNPGIGINGEFFVNRKMAITPSLFTFFPEDRGSYDWTRSEFNGDFHYYFFPSGSVHLCGIAGLNLGMVRARYNNGNVGKNNELGINLGFGINVEINKSRVLPFAEFKYTVSDDLPDQAVLFAGAKIVIK